MKSSRRTLRQVTALCALAVFALTSCELAEKDRDKGQSKEENGQSKEDRWSNRTMPSDHKETDHKEKKDEKVDDWGQPTADKMDDSDDDSDSRWGRPRRDEERVAPDDSSSRWGERRPSGNGSRSSSDGWQESRRPQRDEEKTAPNDSSSRWGQRRPRDNGSRSSSEGWQEGRRPQRDDEKVAPNDSSSRAGRRRPGRNGTRSSSEGWTESYKPSRAWGERAPSERRQAVRARAQQVRENLAKVVENARQLTTFVKALRAAGMFDTLQGRGPFTIFAPSNEAFDALPSGKLDDLMKPENRHELRELLSYHIVSGKLSTEQIGRMRALRSLQGQTLTITVKNGKVYVDDAEVADTGMDGTNGVIHIVNKVLSPE